MIRLRHGHRGLLVAIVTASGCTFGAFGSDVAESPYGARVGVRFGDHRTRTEGELLMMREDGIMMMVADRASLVPWPLVQRIDLDGVPGGPAFEGRPEPDQFEEIRRVSRYPFGLTDAQLAELLESLGQAELDVLR